MSRLEQQMNFIFEMDKIKNITRQTYISDGSRKENDAEHSWHLALMAIVLSEYANEKIDVLKVISMVLIHDLIEIDAGDTYAYDEENNKSKEMREQKAADRIFHILPKDQEVYLRGLWEEFEEGVTMEAKFSAALDKVQPTMLNDAASGVSWKEHDVKISQILKRNQHTKDGSTELWEFALENYLEPNVKKGAIKDDRNE